MLCYGYLTPPKIAPTPTSSEDSMEISDYALIGIHPTITEFIDPQCTSTRVPILRILCETLHARRL